MMKKWLVSILIRLLSSSLKIDYKEIDKKALEDWAFRSFHDRGWRSYFASEDLKILKSMGQGRGPWEYPVLVGRRIQLLYMFNEMKKAYENRKSVEEKKKSQKEGNK